LDGTFTDLQSKQIAQRVLVGEDASKLADDIVNISATRKRLVENITQKAI